MASSRAKPPLVACLALTCVATLTAMTPSQSTGTLPEPFFATWSDGLSMDRATSQATLDRQEATGVGMIRQYIWWDRIETSQGQYNWIRMDQLVRDASDRGIAILPTLLYTPSFYSSKPEGSTSSSLFPPADPQTMARFATEMVKRYGTEGTFWCKPLLPGLPPQCPDPSTYVPITYWEIWNEPDYPSWWKGAPNPGEYFELLKTVSLAIKTADPNAKVVLGSMTNVGGSTTDGYLAKLYQLGAKPYFDLLSLNPYARDVGAMMAYLHGEREVATKNGDGLKPVFITEYGWATGGSSPYIVTTTECQAAFIYEATKQLSDRRDELLIHAVSQFQWHDVSANTAAWPNNAGMIDVSDQAKPSLAAYQAAVAGRPAPAGMTLAAACPGDRQATDGHLQSLTVTKSGFGTGLVKSSPSGITCGDDCYQQYQPGFTITLTATPDPGSAVDGWTDPTCSGTTCTVTMDNSTTDNPKTVGAIFNRVATAGRYEQDDSLVTYTGQWTTTTARNDSGGSCAWATTGPASASMRFEGTGVQWVGRQAPTNGISRVLIDGVRVARVDGYSPRLHRAVTLFDSGDLTGGQHTIRIEFSRHNNAAATDNRTVLDAFVVR